MKQSTFFLLILLLAFNLVKGQSVIYITGNKIPVADTDHYKFYMFDTGRYYYYKIPKDIEQSGLSGTTNYYFSLAQNESILPASIKPESFTDGAYIFYMDSLSRQEVFKGDIFNGRLTGTYFFGSPDNYHDSSLQVKNNMPDGVFKYGRYCFYFGSGYLNHFSFSHPIDDIDTVDMDTRLGKLNSIHFFKTGLYTTLQTTANELLLKNLYSDTAGIIKLKKIIYVPFRSIDGSIEMQYEKIFDFDGGTDRLVYYYNKSRILKKIEIESKIPEIDFLQPNTSLEFDNNGCIRYIEIHSFVSVVDEQGKIIPEFQTVGFRLEPCGMMLL
jgi:hypothetical protein